MKTALVIVLLTLSACASGPPKLTEPPKNAPVWDLNTGAEPGTNNLVHAPTLGDK